MKKGHKFEVEQGRVYGLMKEETEGRTVVTILKSQKIWVLKLYLEPHKLKNRNY